ncbi:hypothetical protein SBRCBS47491_007752 [Sporothrix bragantina]|uniref:pyridoxal 5'-phosphate synthase n=1 Tax=Sporothrix bragantina TaxID=671064 RepID=A0ABP0CFR0_9PEZI
MAGRQVLDPFTDESGNIDFGILLRSLPSLQGPYTSVDWDAFPDTPQDAFVPWLCDAIVAVRSSPGHPYEPHAMTLSTIDSNGFPDARVLILKNLDHRGWHFAAKSDSAKGQQLEANAKCSLIFHWAQLGRQVRIRGVAKQLPAQECAADFMNRPLESRVMALASLQSKVMDEDSETGLPRRTIEAQAILSDPHYAPPTWLVYAVDPLAVEFWQGAENRHHGRLRYTRVAVSPEETTGTWKKERLWP